MGKNGSTWHHGWEPTNPAAVDLKMHRAPGAAAPKRPNLAGRFPSRKMGAASPSKRFAGMTPAQIVTAAKKPAPPKRPNLAGRFPSREMGDTSPSKKFAGMTAGQIAATAPGPITPGLSKSYASGKGATAADVTELARRYEIMHGKPPRAKQVAKIKKAPSARPRKPAMPKADPMAELLKQAKPHQPATPKPPTAITEQHIRDAFTAAGGSHGGFARVTDVKDRMVGTEADKDRALATMFASGKVNLIPQSNQQALTTAQRKRAVRVGGETKHLISLA